MANNRVIKTKGNEHEHLVLSARAGKQYPVAKTNASAENKQAWERAVNDTMQVYKAAWEKLAKY